MSSAVGIKIRAIIVEIKKYKSIIKKKKRKHDKIVLLGKTKLNSIEILFTNLFSKLRRILKLLNLKLMIQ